MDDGFDWLDTLPDDLQHQLWHLMDCVAEGRHAQVDAIVPGLIARARAEERPWVEIFARNFALRSLVLHREDTREGLGRAVSLLDRAHAPDTRDCPQTICTAHAVCAAYGIKDPTGFVDERLKVSTETLGRTDPRRVCWLCISNEHADALIDGGRPDAALGFLEGQRRARLAAGAPVDPDDFGLRETAAHFAAGRLDAAAAALDHCFTQERGASWQRTWDQWKAQLLAAGGDYAAALPHLSSVDDILSDGGFRRHFETLPLLYGKLTPEDSAGHGVDDTEIVRQMCALGIACIARGGGQGVEALIWAGERLFEDGEITLARGALDGARSGLDLLRDAAPARARIDGLGARLDAAKPPAPDPDAADFETALATLRAAPDVAQLAPLTRVAREFGMPALARRLAEQAHAAAPDDEDIFKTAAETLLQSEAYPALDRLLERPPHTEDGPHLAGWYRAAAAARMGEAADALPHLEAIAAARPGWSHVSEQLGGLYFDAGRYLEAEKVWAATAALGATPNLFHWHCIGAATAAGDWARVRELAAIVGFPVPAGEGDFEADYGLIRVLYDDDPRPYYATRTGPLTARVLSLRTPGGPERHGDRVLIHPDVLNREEIEADDDALRVYPTVRTLESSDHICVDLDGRHPGPEALDALRASLKAEDFFFQFGAGDDYEITDPDSGEDHPGVYLLVAARPDDLARLDEIFRAIDGPGPRVWSALHAAAGRPEEAAKHRAIAEAWGMV